MPKCPFPIPTAHLFPVSKKIRTRFDFKKIARALAKAGILRCDLLISFSTRMGCHFMTVCAICPFCDERLFKEENKACHRGGDKRTGILVFFYKKNFLA